MDMLVSILFNYLNGALREDTYTQLAAGMLAHLEDLKRASLEEMAFLLGVSDSTLHRFIRQIGFGNYSGLRLLARMQGEPPKEMEALSVVLEGLRGVDALTLSQLDRVAYEIHRAKNVYLVGYGSFYYPACSFQKLLFTLGKTIVVKQLVSMQDLHLLNLKPDDLLIVVSLEGHFLVSGMPACVCRTLLMTYLEKQANFTYTLTLPQGGASYMLLRVFERLMARYGTLFKS